MLKKKSILNLNWTIKSNNIDVENLLSNLKNSRGVVVNNNIQLNDLISSKELPNIDFATRRILKAINNNEKIIIFGDFDLDGCSSASILYLTLKRFKANVFAKLPKRSDGHGLSKNFFDNCKKNNFKLVITVDCGSSNFEEIEYGNTLGLDTIITDHHTLPSKKPNALAIIHPHLINNKNHPLWGLTGAGVAFFLAKYIVELLIKNKEDVNRILLQLLELSVLGTVADVGVLKDQNRVIAKLGIEQIKKTNHPGLLAIMDAIGVNRSNINTETISFFMAPFLNSSGRLDDPNLSLHLLFGYTEKVMFIKKLNEQRKEITKNLVVIAENIIKENKEDKNSTIVIFHEKFFSGVAGLIASKISEKYNKPTIIFSQTKNNNIIASSCRGPEDFHITNALKQISDLFIQYGGHECAAGCVMYKKNFDTFKNKINKIVKEERGDVPPKKDLIIETIVDFNYLINENFKQIFTLEPFGNGNPPLIFAIENIKIEDIRIIGKNKEHLSGFLIKNDKKIKIIAFDYAKYINKIKNKYITIAFNPTMNTWKNREELQINIVDIKI